MIVRSRNFARFAQAQIEDVPIVIDASQHGAQGTESAFASTFMRQVALSVTVYVATRIVDHILFGRKS